MKKQKAYKFYEMVARKTSVVLPDKCPKCKTLLLGVSGAVFEEYVIVNGSAGELSQYGEFAASTEITDGDTYYPIAMHCEKCGKVLAGGKLKTVK
jgi:phage FluMu protein Com